MCCGYEPGNAPPCRVHNSPIFTVEDVTGDAMVNEKSRKSIDMWDPSDFGAPPRISSGLNVTDPPGPHPVYSFHLENGLLHRHGASETFFAVLMEGSISAINHGLLSQGRQVAPTATL